MTEETIEVIGFTGRGPRSRNLILEKGILLTKDNELPVTEPGEGRGDSGFNTKREV